MTGRRTKIVQMSAFVLLFGVGGIVAAVIVLSAGGGWWALAPLVIGVGVAIIAGIGLISFLRQSDPDAEDALRPVPPPSGPPPPPAEDGGRWPFPALVAGLAAAFDGSGHVVLAGPGMVRVHADLLDARWQHLATVRGINQTMVVTLTESSPGVLRRNDATHSVETVAGVRQIGARIAVRSGRQWGAQRRVEYGMGPDGMKKRVDHSFSTSELNEPIREVLERAGWRTALDAETRTALIIGGIGASALVIVPIAFLISWLLGR